MMDILELEGEEWKELEVAPRYKISNMGRVKSKRTFIKQQPNSKTGLMQAGVYDNEHKFHLINTAAWVGRYFLPKPEDGDMIVCHISSNLQDNRASNLMWAYRSQRKNLQKGIEIEKRPLPTAKSYKYIIKQYTYGGLLIGTYTNFNALEDNGYRKQSIIEASNKEKLYKGYKFEVIKQEK